MNYGYIVNDSKCSYGAFNGVFKSDTSSVHVIGVNSQDTARRAAASLKNSGVNEIDLCFDFDETRRKNINDFIGEEISVKAIDFRQEDAKTVEKIKWDKLGVLVLGDDFSPFDHWLSLSVPGFTLSVLGVSDVDEALEISETLISDGYQVIEFSRHFTEEMILKIKENVHAKNLFCAIGYAGY